MKKYLMGLVLTLMMGSSSLFAGSFEGVVNYQTSFEDGKKMDLEYMVKGKKVRSDMNHDGMQMSTILDSGSRKMTMLMHKQKMYSIHSMDSVAKEVSKHPVKGKFHKASGSKTILGHSCDHWVYEGEEGKSDIWMASDIGSFEGFTAGTQGSQTGFEWLKGIKGKSLFMMEMENTGKNGKTMTMVVTKLEQKSLPSSLFSVPSGYKKMPDYGAMMKGQKSPSGEDMLKGMKPKLPF